MDDETLTSLLSCEVVEWMKNALLALRSNHGHGTLELHVQDGYLLTYHEKKSYKVSGRSRIRTHNK